MQPSNSKFPRCKPSRHAVPFLAPVYSSTADILHIRSAAASAFREAFFMSNLHRFGGSQSQFLFSGPFIALRLHLHLFPSNYVSRGQRDDPNGTRDAGFSDCLALRVTASSERPRENCCAVCDNERGLWAFPTRILIYMPCQTPPVIRRSFVGPVSLLWDQRSRTSCHVNGRHSATPRRQL